MDMLYFVQCICMLYIKFKNFVFHHKLMSDLCFHGLQKMTSKLKQLFHYSSIIYHSGEFLFLAFGY